MGESEGNYPKGQYDSRTNYVLVPTTPSSLEKMRKCGNVFLKFVTLQNLCEALRVQGRCPQIFWEIKAD